LAHRGFFPVDELLTFRHLDSRLQGHPDRVKLPGVEVCAGPLGHGVAVGVGMALAQRMNSRYCRAEPRGRGCRSGLQRQGPLRHPRP
jgi:transketolase